MSKRILIGCEESFTVAGAFRKAGFNAYSCDLKPTRGNRKYHLQMDIMKAIYSRKWDLIILHIDCTCLALCGNRTYGRGKLKYNERLKAIKWSIKLWNEAIRVCDKVALENPSSVIFKHLIGDTQYIQPYQFGHTEQKKTGLKLHGLPRLQQTKNVYEEMMKLPKKDREKVFYMSPGIHRKRDRSVTYSGIATAFVKQWGKLL